MSSTLKIKPPTLALTTVKHLLKNEQEYKKHNTHAHKEGNRMAIRKFVTLQKRVNRGIHECQSKSDTHR